MRPLAMLVVGVVALFGLGCGKSDRDAIQGTWIIESLESDGIVAPADKIKNSKLVFTADKCVMDMDGEKTEETYKLDPGAKQKSIDLTITAKEVTTTFATVGASIGKTIGGPVSTAPKDEPMPKVESKPPVEPMPKVAKTRQENVKGIYALDGDTLKICLAEPKKDRPTEFSGQKGLILLVLKRAK